MNAYLVAAATIVVFMVVMWLISLAITDASIVDIGWGFGFVLVAWTTALWAGTWGRTTIALVAATTIWGLRLAGYLAWRNLGHGEDFRYQKMREGRGAAFWWQSLYVVFGLQGALMWVVSLPQQATATSTDDIGVLAWIGLAIWLIGVAWETTADLQLARFKGDPSNAGSVLDRGVWRLSRHPNYFGDFTAWWGMYLVAASVGGWWTIVGPLVMSFLLLRVSGVAMLERSLTKTKPSYAEYVDTTNAFFPGPKRSSAS